MAPSESKAEGAERDDAPWVSLRVRTLEADTGRAVPSTWNLGTGRVTSGPFPAGAVIDEEALARSQAAAEESLRKWEAAFLNSGMSRPEALDPSSPLRHPYVVRPPTGYVRDDPGTHIRGVLAAGVRHAEVVVPLWPEAVLDVRVLNPEGRPARGVDVEAVSAAGRLRRTTTERRSPGEFRIRGIPRIPGEPFRALLMWDWSDDTEEEFQEVIEEEECVELSGAHIVSVIPTDTGHPWETEVQLMAARGPDVCFVEVDYDCEFEESFGETEQLEPPEQLASVRVRVEGIDGKPVADALVNGQATDQEGQVLLTDLNPGSALLRMQATGRFPATREVVLKPGGTGSIVLREPRGASVDIRVSDEAGRPRPSAQLIICDRLVFDVNEGVQRLDLFTDANGQRRLARIEPGMLTIQATWGSRKGSATLEVQDGESYSVHIIAK